MPTNSTKTIEVILYGALAVLVSVLIWLGSVPPVSRDALTHHLYVPKLYLMHGFGEIPWIGFSYYPMNLDLLYLMPLYWGNDIVPKYIHCAFALLTALLIFRYLKRWLGQVYGLLGAVFFLTVPVVVKLAITVYVDLGLIFFSTASLFFLIKWIESNLKLRYVFYSAIFCGLALGTKYNGLLILFIMALMMPLLSIRNRQIIIRESTPDVKAVGYGRMFFHWVLFGVVALVVFSPWLWRNYNWTGNPLHPFYASIFAPSERSAEEENRTNPIKKLASPFESGKSNHFVSRRLVYNESGWDIVMIPLRIFFQGQDDNPKYFDGKLTPLLLLLPMFALVGIKSEQRLLVLGKFAWLLFAGLYLSIAFLATDMRIRYISPIIPPLVILSIFGFKNILKIVRTNFTGNKALFLKYAILFLIIGVWGNQLKYIVGQYRIYRPDLYLSGQVSRDAYIKSFRPEYGAIQYANQNIPEGSRIMGVYLGGRGYYSNHDIRFSYGLNTIQESTSPGNLAQRLRESGFSHILINSDQFDRWTKPRLQADEIERLQAFFKHKSKRLYHEGPIALYAIDG